MTTAPTQLTIMFWPESAYGPTNQCIGLAAILRDRGHTIVFAAESSWAGKLAPFGFVEELVDLAEPDRGRRRRGRRASSGPTSSPRLRRSSASRRSSSSSRSSSRRIRHSSTERSTASRGCARSSPRTAPTSSSRTTWCSSPRWPRRARRSCASCRAARSRSAGPVCHRRSRGCPAPTASSGRTTAPSSSARTATCGPTSTRGCRRRGRPRCPTWSSCPAAVIESRRQSLRLSGRGRLPRRPAARRQLDQDGFQRARDRRGVRRCPPPSPTGPTAAR